MMAFLQMLTGWAAFSILFLFFGFQNKKISDLNSQILDLKKENERLHLGIDHARTHFSHNQTDELISYLRKVSYNLEED